MNINKLIYPLTGIFDETIIIQSIRIVISGKAGISKKNNLMPKTLNKIFQYFSRHVAQTYLLEKQFQ